MSNPHEGPFTVANVVRFFEQMAGEQWMDANTGRPMLDVVREEKQLKAAARKSDYELWLEEQDEAVRLEHEMGAF